MLASHLRPPSRISCKPCNIFSRWMLHIAKSDCPPCWTATSVAINQAPWRQKMCYKTSTLVNKLWALYQTFDEEWNWQNGTDDKQEFTFRGNISSSTDRVFIKVPINPRFLEVPVPVQQDEMLRWQQHYVSPIGRGSNCRFCCCLKTTTGGLLRVQAMRSDGGYYFPSLPATKA